MQSRWMLYNKEDKLRIDDLTADQVKTILLAIPTARMKDWFACRGGDVHWQPLLNIPEFYEDVRAMRGISVTSDEVKEANLDLEPAKTPVAAAPPPPPAPPARRPMFEEMQHLTAPTLAVDKVTVQERRSARRYKCRLEFKIIHGGKTFSSTTEDVSMTGLAITEALPTWVPKTFRAQVGSNGQVLSIVAARVESAEAVRMKLMDAESWELLRRWIVNW